MSDRMNPPALSALLEDILSEYAQRGTVLEVKPQPICCERPSRLPGGVAETLFGPAAGPHTQLAGNIVAAYVAGARFFELKTVQTLDGADLPVAKPCISAPDEGYNVEWSTELTVEQARDEYIKAWFLCWLLGEELELGRPGAFIFNISVGYDLAGITSPKIDGFIEALKDASATEEWQRCRAAALDALPQLRRVGREFIDAIPAAVCSSVTLSTLHGCPWTEIEAIAGYLLKEKALHTYVKLNPTLLGYQRARDILSGQGWQLSFSEQHFDEDLQMADAVPLLTRLLRLAEECRLEFGVKLTNTFPVQITDGRLPGEEMYMSGRSLFPLSIRLAHELNAAFDGRLPISFCGGADEHNIVDLLNAGLRPVTLATALLKPGGYARLSQLAQLTAVVQQPLLIFASRLSQLADSALSDPHYHSPGRTRPARRRAGGPPLLDCFTPPCRNACPLGQDVPAYLRALAQGDQVTAARIVLERNPLPHVTSEICPHPCQDSCTRRFLDQAVQIRACKNLAARSVATALSANAQRHRPGGRVAIVGGGPAGLAAAAFVQRAGWQATLFEREAELGGAVRQAVPGFRLSSTAIDEDVALVQALGAELRRGWHVTDLTKLRREYNAVILAVGAQKDGELPLEQGRALPAVAFLRRFNRAERLELGHHVCVIGGGNVAMDAARAALRCPGVQQVSVVYRRDADNMPADAEELALAQQEGVEFRPLRTPLSFSGAMLECGVMRLGERDSSGRRRAELTNERELIPCSSVISAVGQQVDADFLATQMIRTDERGLPQVDANGQSSRDDIYVIGDGAHGPATVAEAIADALRAVSAITGCAFDTYAAEDRAYHGLAERGAAQPAKAQCDAARCLECGGRCLLCVETCPNRANRQVLVDGQWQVVHFDDLCNECGNCAQYCPWQGAPYRDKLTVFSTQRDWETSTNRGLVLLPDGRCLLRSRGVLSELKWTEATPPTLGQLLSSLKDFL